MNYQEIASASALLKDQLNPVFEKIGQGTQWGYGIFVKQAYANAISELLWIPFGVFCFWAWSKLCNLAKKDDETKSAYSSNATFYYMAAVFCLLLGFFLVLNPLADLIQVLINPDYAAIKLIIETVKQVR